MRLVPASPLEQMVARVYEIATSLRPDWHLLPAEIAALFRADYAAIGQVVADKGDRHTIETIFPAIERQGSVEAELAHQTFDLLVAELRRLPSGTLWISRERGAAREGLPSRIEASLPALRLPHLAAALEPRYARRARLLVLGRASGPPFAADELDGMRILADHIGRAAALGRQVEDAKVAGPEILDILNFGVVLLDAEGRPRRANRSARAILGGEHERSLKPFRFRAASGDEVDLRAVVERIGITRADGPPVSLTMTDPRDGREIMAMLLPWPHAPDRHPTAVTALLLLSETDQHSLAVAAAFRARYRLTGRETELTLAFARSGTLKAAAEELSISWETARRHLKSIFEKTGTHSQIELLELLLTLPESSDRGPAAGEDQPPGSASPVGRRRKA